MSRIYYPPGTPRAIRKRVDAWKSWRSRNGRPCPCWGWYLLSLERAPMQLAAAREASQQALERMRAERANRPSRRPPREVNRIRAELSRMRVEAVLAGRPLPRRCWL